LIRCRLSNKRQALADYDFAKKEREEDELIYNKIDEYCILMHKLKPVFKAIPLIYESINYK